LESQIATNYGEIVDMRDRKAYQTIQINNRVWLAENMKFKTERSENFELSDVGMDIDGYYYPFEEINQVCPSGFRIPTSGDWKNYFDSIIESKGIAESSEEYIGKDKKNNEFIANNISDSKLKPFEDPNPLKLKAYGHTQGGKLVGIGSMNFWINHNDSTDPKYHLHLIDDGYSIHTHKHHIIDKKKKRRKFSVRCVKDYAIE